jgi:hypothetical protein
MLPKELLDEADRVFGARKRSEIITALLEESLRKERFKAAVQALLASPAGIQDVPEEWKTSEGAARWVRTLREEWTSTNLDLPH